MGANLYRPERDVEPKALRAATVRGAARNAASKAALGSGAAGGLGGLDLAALVALAGGGFPLGDGHGLLLLLRLLRGAGRRVAGGLCGQFGLQGGEGRE